jgi:hypothetical protein
MKKTLSRMLAGCLLGLSFLTSCASLSNKFEKEVLFEQKYKEVANNTSHTENYLTNLFTIQNYINNPGDSEFQKIVEKAKQDGFQVGLWEVQQIWEKQVILEEAQRIARDIKEKKIRYVVDYINYENCSVETNWFQPPNITEQINRGDCKDLTFLLNSRLNKRGVNDFYTVFGRVDKDWCHTWGIWESNGKNYLVCPQSGVVIDTHSISNKFFIPDPQLSDYKREKIKELKKKPGCQNLKFNDDFNKPLGSFGIPPGEKGRQ